MKRIVLFLFFASVATADGTPLPSPPRPNMTTIVHGIGFVDTPQIVEANCIKTQCRIVRNYGSVRLEINYPSDLMYSGSRCLSTNDDYGFNFTPVAEKTRIHADSIGFRLISADCGTRYIDLTYFVSDQRTDDQISSDIMLANRSWSVCILRRPNAWLCDENRTVSSAANRQLFDAISRWSVQRFQNH